MSTDIDMTRFSQALSAFARMITRGSSIVDGIIISIDKINFSCTIAVGTGSNITNYSNVPLKVLTGLQASMIEIPKVNSKCLMQFRDRNILRPQLYSCHEVEEILINAPKVIFNKGDLGGMVKVKELQTQSNKDKDIIDAMLDIINGAQITEPGNGSPSAFQTALKSALSGKQTGSWDDIENTSITQ